MPKPNKLNSAAQVQFGKLRQSDPQFYQALSTLVAAIDDLNKRVKALEG